MIQTICDICHEPGAQSTLELHVPLHPTGERIVLNSEGPDTRDYIAVKVVIDFEGGFGAAARRHFCRDHAQTTLAAALDANAPRRTS